jgi:Protein of unknown function (DUF1203)
MSFRVRGLSPEPFRSHFKLSDAELKSLGALRVVADSDSYPCRVSLEHAPVGDELVLINYEHQPGHTPYQSRHAIYVCRNSIAMFDEVDVIPETIRSRLISVRAFDAAHMMIDADVVDGTRAAEVFDRFLSNPAISYLHVHNAKRGCYAAHVARA